VLGLVERVIHVKTLDEPVVIIDANIVIKVVLYKVSGASVIQSASDAHSIRLASGRDIVVIVAVKVGSSVHSYSLSVILLDLFSDAVSIFFVSVLVSDRAALVHVLPPEAERKGASLIVVTAPRVASSPLRGLSVRSEGDFAGLADLVGHENSEEVEGSG
jgi:hypothetical protein